MGVVVDFEDYRHQRMLEDLEKDLMSLAGEPDALKILEELIAHFDSKFSVPDCDVSISTEMCYNGPIENYADEEIE